MVRARVNRCMGGGLREVVGRKISDVLQMLILAEFPDPEKRLQQPTIVAGFAVIFRSRRRRRFAHWASLA